MSAIAASGNFGDLLTPGFRKLYNERYKAKASIIPLVYSMVTAENKSFVKDSSVGSFDDPTNFSGQLQYDTVSQQYDITVNFPEIAAGFKIERKLYDDDLYNIMNKKPRGLARAMARAREKDATSLFEEAFTYEPSDGDGAELCASDHGSASDTSYSKSNEGTTALSPASLTATRILMMKFTDDRDNRIEVMPDTIIIPLDLEDTFDEITKSKLKAHELSNTTNVQEGRWKKVILPYMTDTTNWFMADSDMMEEMLIWVDRVKAEFGKDMSSDTFNAKYYTYARWNKYWNDWRFIYGHNV